MQCVYLDYNGTSPIFPEVSREVLPYVTSCFGNPSSSHAHGVASKAAVDLARKRVAALIGCDEDEIVFTCSGTESDNWALLGALRQHASTAAAGDRSGAPHIVSSAIEHPAVLEQLRDLQRRGAADFTLVGVGPEGAVCAREVAEAVTERTVLVTLMHSNNEVGSLQPVAEVARLCRERGILCHTDAAQSLGKVKIDVRELGVDMLTIVGHKFGAPKGIAALYIRREVLADFPPFLLGGGQEGGKRAGTESTAMIVGLGKACQIALDEADATTAHMRKLRDLLLASLGRRLPPGTLSRVHGPSDVARRLPNTLSIAVDGIRAAPLLKRIGDRFAASAGAACHSKPADGSAAADCPKISAVLRAMGVPPSLAVGTIRLSVGRHTTADEVERGADILAAAIRQELSAAA
ncbi:pyridoxal phosphate-dependent transferase [Tribonema minus]|uniref:Pyridoxal phosphate-dependent transferase n=1 Tax=Tribonema minus TaxID=303371 RepID=A0A836CMI1_9STRA|nr:pyridoxal phosphate-dependent transferase [Tribonema minus]